MLSTLLFIIANSSTSSIHNPHKNLNLIEPNYVSIPKYVKLKFGNTNKPAMLVIFDKGCVYIDLNNNNDLTEPQEKFETPEGFSNPTDASGRSPACGPNGKYRIDGITTVRKVRGVLRTAFYIFIDEEFVSTYPCVSDTPEDAEVVQFDGPRMIAMYRPDVAFLSGQEQRIDTTIGALGVGMHSIALMQHDKVPKEAYIEMTVKFPSREGGGPSITKVYQLMNRCCGNLFYDQVKVPQEVGLGKAQVSLRVVNWDAGKVAPYHYEVDVVDKLPVYDDKDKWEWPAKK